jgi:hypothetical protein
MAAPNANNPNNFPYLDGNGQLVLGNATLRVLLADSLRLLDRNIRDRYALLDSNITYLDNLDRMLRYGNLREAERVGLHQRRQAIEAETQVVRGDIRRMDAHRRIVREASNYLAQNNA